LQISGFDVAEFVTIEINVQSLPKSRVADGFAQSMNDGAAFLISRRVENRIVGTRQHVE
jgi:hypothetical protein